MEPAQGRIEFRYHFRDSPSQWQALGDDSYLDAVIRGACMDGDRIEFRLVEAEAPRGPARAQLSDPRRFRKYASPEAVEVELGAIEARHGESQEVTNHAKETEGTPEVQRPATQALARSSNQSARDLMYEAAGYIGAERDIAQRLIAAAKRL